MPVAEGHAVEKAGDAIQTAAQVLIGHRIDKGRICLQSILGSGSFGVVFLAYGPADQETLLRRRFAVKCLNKATDANQVRLIRREIDLHLRVSGHSGIVALQKVVEEPDWFYLVLDYYPEGDLFRQIVHQGRFYGKDALIKTVYIQLLDAVEHCHNLSVFHRDLKPENVLCEGERVVLTDFGLATSQVFSVEFGCGSGFYMSPEVYGHPRRPYSPAKADIWSLGVILVNLVTGRNPWRKAICGDAVYDFYLRDPDALFKVLPISSELNDLLKRVFMTDPGARLTIPQLREAVLRIDHLNKPDVPTESWRDALERDRAALAGNIRQGPRVVGDTPPKLPEIKRLPEINVTNCAGGPPPGLEGFRTPPKGQARDYNVHGRLNEQPAGWPPKRKWPKPHLFHAKRDPPQPAMNPATADTLEADSRDPFAIGRSQDRARVGPAPASPTMSICSSSSSSSASGHALFPRTPQMPAGDSAGVVPGHDWQDDPASFAHRRASIRRHILSSSKHNVAGGPDDVLQNGSAAAVLFAAQNRGSFRQKVRSWMHKSKADHHTES